MTKKKAKRIAKKYVQRMVRFNYRACQSLFDIRRYGDRHKLAGKRLRDMPYESEWIDAVDKANEYALFGHTGVFSKK